MYQLISVCNINLLYFYKNFKFIRLSFLSLKIPEEDCHLPTLYKENPHEDSHPERKSRKALESNGYNHGEVYSPPTGHPERKRH